MGIFIEIKGAKMELFTMGINSDFVYYMGEDRLLG